MGRRDNLQREQAEECGDARWVCSVDFRVPTGLFQDSGRDFKVRRYYEGKNNVI